MNETVNLRYEPVGEGQFPLLGKVYAEAWKGSSSAFAPSKRWSEVGAFRMTAISSMPSRSAVAERQ